MPTINMITSIEIMNFILITIIVLKNASQRKHRGDKLTTYNLAPVTGSATDIFLAVARIIP